MLKSGLVSPENVAITTAFKNYMADNFGMFHRSSQCTIELHVNGGFNVRDGSVGEQHELEELKAVIARQKRELEGLLELASAESRRRDAIRELCDE